MSSRRWEASGGKVGRVNDWTGIWAASGKEVDSSVGDLTGVRGVLAGERVCLCSGMSLLDDMMRRKGGS